MEDSRQPTILDYLRAISTYPVPVQYLEGIAIRRMIVLEQPVDTATSRSKDFNLATADVLMWLSCAPDVSQGGQSYSFTDEQRQQFRNRANSIYGKYAGNGEDDETAGTKAIYGYKGSRL